MPTVPIYFSDKDAEILSRIDEDRKYMSRSAWFKNAAQFYLDHQLDNIAPVSNPVKPVTPYSGLSSFLDSL